MNHEPAGAEPGGSSSLFLFCFHAFTRTLRNRPSHDGRRIKMLWVYNSVLTVSGVEKTRGWVFVVLPISRHHHCHHHHYHHITCITNGAGGGVEVFKKQQSSKSHGTRHDLRLLRPHTITGGPSLGPARLSFLFACLLVCSYFCGVEASICHYLLRCMDGW